MEQEIVEVITATPEERKEDALRANSTHEWIRLIQRMAKAAAYPSPIRPRTEARREMAAVCPSPIQLRTEERKVMAAASIIMRKTHLLTRMRGMMSTSMTPTTSLMRTKRAAAFPSPIQPRTVERRVMAAAC